MGQDFSRRLAEVSLSIGSIKLNPSDPFTWTSGYRMPIYNDNRLLLGDFEHRSLVAGAFVNVLESKDIHLDVVAGVATAGIPHATSLADNLTLPLIYVREKPKAHGTRSQIEGQLKSGATVLLVEDLVSTGKSSIAAVNAVREAGGTLSDCVCIFSYGFPELIKLFHENNCQLHPLLTFNTMLDVALDNGYVNKSEADMLKSWNIDPFSWGEKHGFPKVEKS